MIINNREIELSHKEVALLNKFFNENKEFIETKNMFDYEVIKELGDRYKEFLDREEINDNVLKLFLMELRVLELSYKITSNSIPLNIINVEKNYDNINIPGVINKWIYECNKENYKEKKIRSKIKEM